MEYHIVVSYQNPIKRQNTKKKNSIFLHMFLINKETNIQDINPKKDIRSHRPGLGRWSAVVGITPCGLLVPGYYGMVTKLGL